MQLLVAILSETKLVIGILLALAIHGVANAAIPANVVELGCGQNIISLDEQSNTVTKVCRSSVVGEKINLLSLSYANGTSERFAIIKDQVITDSGSAAVHQLTLKAYSASGTLSGETSLAVETVTLNAKDSTDQVNSIIQIKGITPNHVTFDAWKFKSNTPAQSAVPVLPQTETL